MEPDWLTEDEERAWRAFRRLLTVLPARIARDLVGSSGLSAADYEVLSTLSEQPTHRWPLKELASKTEWSRSRLSHHTTRMQQRGLIEREPDPDDARGCILRLSTHGMQTLQAAAPAHVASVRTRFIDQLTPAELVALEHIATRIADLSE